MTYVLSALLVAADTNKSSTLGKRQNITVRLGYEMEFAEPFDIYIKNSGNLIHTYEDFLREFLEVEIYEG